MSKRPYGMICPITLACDLLEPRWTIPILTEMWSGSRRFNDIRRGVGSISTALLSKRLKEMQETGLIKRVKDSANGDVNYFRTEMAIELEPALNSLAVWAQRHVDARIAVCDTKLPVLMWKLRRAVVVERLPQRRLTIRFQFSDPNLEFDTYWLLVRPGSDNELCTEVPGIDVDLFVETSLASLTSILLARSSVSKEVSRGQLYVSGDATLAKTMDKWLPQSSYGDIDGIATS
ncbi:helix-turn-helix domain-containing protein [Phaeobacter sp. NW0010-22]|uniref:winged helix-turn-helix transcriptional regulator n=1 Tax=Phaeobacter sp. NW0010-22 TaxID=3135907 RepID=UPI003108E571